MWCFESTTAASSVDRMMCAISLAMRANGVPVERDFYVSLVVSVAKRRRKKPVNQRRGLSFVEARGAQDSHEVERVCLPRIAHDCGGDWRWFFVSDAFF